MASAVEQGYGYRLVRATEDTISALGFDWIRQELARGCRTPLGIERALARPFLPNVEAAKEELSLVAEAQRLVEEPISLPFNELTDLRDSLERAEKGGLLEPNELVAVCHALFAFEHALEIIGDRADALPGLARIAEALPALHQLSLRLERAFTPERTIADDASPELAAARVRVRALHRRIRGQLEELLRDEAFSSMLQEQYFSVRDDRYVVPVKAAHQRELPGIVHNASQTGQTLFIEPTALVPLGNELTMARVAEREEEVRVLLTLSGLVGAEGGKIARGLAAVARLDELESAGRLSHRLRATIPTLTAPAAGLALRKLRHPRLALREAEVVPNDLALPGNRALVISGPNAGGKTVTLTGVGLSAMMLAAGLPSSLGDGSAIPFFDEIHTALGDQQDLSRGLSTFSAHMTSLAAILKSAGPGALVLIDEVAAGTAPQEGAAIATAVLEAFLDRGATVIVTTHLEELKALAHVDERFLNARVGFDSKRMTPTYQLSVGSPGTSSAIDISRQAGLPEELCQRASQLLSDTGGALAKAVRAAELERERHAEATAQVERSLAELATLRNELDAEREELAQRRAREEESYRTSLAAELQDSRQKLRALLEELAKERNEKAVAAAAAKVAERLNDLSRTAQPQATKAEPRVGDELFHRSFGRAVVVVSVDKEHALVQAGNLKTRVRLDELSPLPAGARASSAKARAAVSDDSYAPAVLDVRGTRAEEALRKVEKFVDQMAVLGVEQAQIIHGHGTGALRNQIRAFLQKAPQITSHRPGDPSEGGDGVTVLLF